MRWLALVVVLCACDRVLGLGHAVPADAFDAAFFDAPESFVCPPLGATPSYLPDLHQVLQQSCDSYTASANGVALGTCFDDSGRRVVMSGSLDMTLQTASGFADLSANLLAASIGADGTALMVVNTLGSNDVYEYRTYTQRPDLSWVRGSDLIPSMPSSVGGFLTCAPPSATTPRHLVYVDANSTTFHELVETGTVWSEASWSPVTLAQLGLVNVRTLHLSGDGLRLVISALDTSGISGAAYYSDRMAIDMPFRQPVDRLAIVPDQAAPFMTEDCAHVYVVGLDRVFYLQQR